jgi:hypothetical protein
MGFLTHSNPQKSASLEAFQSLNGIIRPVRVATRRTFNFLAIFFASQSLWYNETVSSLDHTTVTLDHLKPLQNLKAIKWHLRTTQEHLEYLKHLKKTSNLSLALEI